MYSYISPPRQQRYIAQQCVWRCLPCCSRELHAGSFQHGNHRLRWWQEIHFQEIQFSSSKLMVGMMTGNLFLIPLPLLVLVSLPSESDSNYIICRKEKRCKKYSISNVCFLTKQPYATNIDNRGLDIVVPGWWIRQTDCKGTAWEGIKVALVSKANIFLRL